MKTATEIGNDIAAHMPGWIIEDDPNATDCWGTINGPGGMGICLYRQSDGRIRASGVWPRSKTENYTFEERNVAPTITFAADRDPASVAKDIARRLLKEYGPAYHRQVARRDAHDAAENARRDRVREIMAALGREPDDDHFRQGYKISVWKSPVDQFQVYGDGDVRLEIRCGHAMALKVIAVLKESAG
jgi:hypothetical protein